MYLGIDIHKRYAQVAVLDENGEIDREVRVLAADKGYDGQWLRETLREDGIRPLIKHCVYAPYDHAHNARIDERAVQTASDDRNRQLLSQALARHE